MGIEEKRFGFGLGKAPKESKPTFPMDSSFMGRKEESQGKDGKSKVEVALKRYSFDDTVNLQQRRLKWLINMECKASIKMNSLNCSKKTKVLNTSKQ